jgi:SNF2 family DNA or RNA helicase
MTEKRVPGDRRRKRRGPNPDQNSPPEPKIVGEDLGNSTPEVESVPQVDAAPKADALPPLDGVEVAPRAKFAARKDVVVPRAVITPRANIAPKVEASVQADVITLSESAPPADHAVQEVDGSPVEMAPQAEGMTPENVMPRRIDRHRRNGNPRDNNPQRPNAAPQANTPSRENRHSVNRDGLEQRCIRQFPRPVLVRGRQYFQSDNVSDPTLMGEAFSLVVVGKGERYTVWIDFSKAGSAGTIEAKCTCPYYDTAGLCKHVWASIIKLERSGLSAKVPGKGPLRILRDGGKPIARIVPLARPIVGQVIHANHGPQDAPNAWIERLDQIQGKNVRSATAGNVLAAYVIHAAETVTAGKLVLDFWSRRKGMGQDVGPLRPDRAPDRELQLLANLRDQELVALLTRTCAPKVVTTLGRSCTRFTVDPIVETQILTTLSGSGNAFISRSHNGSPDNADRPLRMDRGKAWETELVIEDVGARYRLEGRLKRDDETKSLNETICIFSSGAILFGEQIGRLAEPRHSKWLRNLRSGEFLVPRDQIDAFVKRILTDSSAPPVTWPDGLEWKRSLIEPIPKGVFLPLGNDISTGRMTLTVSFDYGGHIIALSDPAESVVDVEARQVHVRNREFEEATLTQALEILRDPSGAIPTSDLQRSATELSQNGWSIFIEGQRVIVAEDFALNVTSSADWFDVSLAASFGGNPFRKEEILAALENKSTSVRLKDGSIGFLPEEWLTRYATLRDLGTQGEAGSLRFEKNQGLLLNAVLGDDDDVRGDKGFDAFRTKILSYDLTKTAKAPVGFKGKLRDYQKEGLTWLTFLKDFESGGVLADDMGLGKTIQMLAFLLSRQKESKLPSLVVAPKSLIFNWIDEAQKFAPTLKVVRYVGGERKKIATEIGDADLIVTTYGTLRADIAKLREQEFDVAIIDEAQFVKNPKSQAAIACKQLRAKHRLALTGTPIENSIQDLLSILEFTNPGLLRFPAGDGAPKDVESALARLLKPFMLRRTKEAVLKELPDKSEQVLFCEMGAEETEYYSVIRDRYRESIEQSVTKNGLGKSKLHVLEALLRLRQAACHAGLIDEAKREIPSAKLELLLARLKEVIAEGHKALVFSQFTSLLSIVKTSLDAEGITYEYLDGQTTDRKTPVDRFQSEDGAPVFLVSLKAGGTGLNLTAADYVFILDPWWNPAVEAQAIGRAHRMGQTQKVIAYRLVARGTVEEKILELQKKKKDLAESIVSEDTDFMKKLSKEDLADLLAP